MSRIFAGILRSFDRCHPARSTCITTKYEASVVDTCGSQQIHHLGIGRGENERGHFPFRWRYSRIDVGIVAYDLTWRPRPHSRRSPGTSGDAHTAEAAFI